MLSKYLIAYAYFGLNIVKNIEKVQQIFEEKDCIDEFKK